VPVDTSVLIAGAGPTGLTLACELARRQVPFRLIDGAPAPFNGSRGKGLQPRSLEVFDDLGIASQAVAGGRFHMPMRIYAADGYRDVDVHEGREPRPDVPYASSLIIPQWRVEDLLRQKLGELGGRVEYAVSLRELSNDGDGVSVVLEHADGRKETARAAWLAGCDGGRSTVRKLAGVSFDGETLDQHQMLVGDVRVSGLDREHWHIWRTDKGFLALAPLPATDQFQFQASVDPALSEEPSLALFQRIVEERSGRSDIHLDEPTWMSRWRANMRMVDRYRVGRIFLAGDAAHVHSPAGAQGMNTGIQDAYNLGWKLAAVVGGIDDTLLDTYEDERMPVARWVLGLSTKLHFSILATQRADQPRDEQTLQLGINYRHGRLTREYRTDVHGPQAGDRAPDAPALRDDRGEHRLFDRFRGTHMTLLAFGTSWAGLLDDIEREFHGRVQVVSIADGRTQDSGGHAARAYGVTRDTLFVIRPDGYIGLATEVADISPIAAYLRQLI